MLYVLADKVTRCLHVGMGEEQDFGHAEEASQCLTHARAADGAPWYLYSL